MDPSLTTTRDRAIEKMHDISGVVAKEDGEGSAGESDNSSVMSKGLI